MFPQSRNDPIRHRSAVDRNADLIIRYPSHVIHQGRVEHCQSQLGPLPVPPLENRERNSSVEKSPEAASTRSRETQECGIRRGAHGDVIRMAEDAIRAEGAHHVGLLLVEYGCDHVSQVLGRNIGDGAIWVPEPFMTVRNPTECTPAGLVLGATNCTQRGACSRETIANLPRAAIGRMNQDEPEALVVAMQGDGASHPVRVIIRMRHDREEDTSGSHAMRIADATAYSTAWLAEADARNLLAIATTPGDPLVIVGRQSMTTDACVST